jgi:hypothetical protein
MGHTKAPAPRVKRRKPAGRYFLYVDFVDNTVVVNARLPKQLSRVINLAAERITEHIEALRATEYVEAARASKTGN